MQFIQTEGLKSFLDQSGINTWIIITDSNVEKLDYFQAIINICQGKTIHVKSFPAGEANKTIETKNKIELDLLEQGFRKNIGIIAIGGGIVLDVAGFIAATFCRGITYITIPTTLMAMVDVCVGGKTGVNTPYGKNTIGAIYLPQAALIDIKWLKTLPDFEYRCAFSEVIKMALLDTEQTLNKLYTSSISNIIADSNRIKLAYIKNDLYDNDQRQHLNLGHTIGHAIEFCSNWEVSHGQAVASGLLFTSLLSIEIFNFNYLDKLLRLIDNYNIPTIPLQKYSVNELWLACHQDKKINKNRLNWIILQDIGNAKIIDTISWEIFNKIYCNYNRLTIRHISS